MKTRIVGSALVVLGLGLALVPATANAAVTKNLKFEFLEVGSDVVATVTGSLDRGAGSGLAFSNTNTTKGGVFRTPTYWSLSVGPTSSWTGSAVYSGLTLNSGSGAPANLPPSSNVFTYGDSGSGLLSYLVENGGIPRIGVDNSYIDGAAFNSTTTWLGKSFSTLGLNTGTWVYGYGSAGNTITMQIGSSAVPEPGEWAAMGVLGAGLTGLVLRKRRRA